MKTMLLHFKNFFGDTILKEYRIYDEFNLYGERWCVTHSNHNMKPDRYFRLNHYGAGVSVGMDSYYKVKMAKSEGRKKLLRVECKNVLKFVKKYKTINKDKE